jgi:hypothetical protein
MINALIFFLFITLGMGFSISRLLGIKEKGCFSATVGYMAIGIIAFVMFSVFLGYLNLAIWYIYIILTVLILAAAWYYKDAFRNLPRLKIDRDWIIVFIIFFIHLFVYIQGSYAYPYLEDEDPWSHAEGVRYVSEFATFLQPDFIHFRYLAPYPPFYDVLMGVLFQFDGGSMQDLLKGMNAVLVSLGIPFFYLFSRKWFGPKIGLWSTFIVAILPSFMSHFIWAQTLAMILVFPALYFLERYLNSDQKENRGLLLIAVAASTCVFIAQPSAAAKYFGLFAIYFVSKVLFDLFGSRRKFKWQEIKPLATVFISAFALALVLYWIPMFLIYEVEEVLLKLSLSVDILTEENVDTSGGIVYGFIDFIHAPDVSKMDQPTGWGEMVFLLLVLGIARILVNSSKNGIEHKELTLLIWFLFGLIGTEGNMLPIKLVPHRFWVFLAIPVSIIAAIGVNTVISYIKERYKSATLAVTVIIVMGLLWTSAFPKYAVETSNWPPGAIWVSGQQVGGYVNLMKKLPVNTKVYSFCMFERHMDGFDFYGMGWEEEIINSKLTSITDSIDDNYELASKYEYEYVVIDQGCIRPRKFKEEEIKQKLLGLSNDQRFEHVKELSSDVFFVFRVR